MKHSEVLIIIFLFLLTTVCLSYVKPVEQITFLCHSITITSAVIVLKVIVKFTLDNIYCDVKFIAEECLLYFFCGNIFLRITGKSQKLGPQKIRPHGI